MQHPRFDFVVCFRKPQPCGGGVRVLAINSHTRESLDQCAEHLTPAVWEEKRGSRIESRDEKLIHAAQIAELHPPDGDRFQIKGSERLFDLAAKFDDRQRMTKP